MKSESRRTLCVWGLSAIGLAMAVLALGGFSCLPHAGGTPAVPLSEEERAWLAGHAKALTLLYNTDFPPMEFAAANGAFTGFGADVIAQVEKGLGVTFLKRSSGDWNEHLSALARGECAIAPTIVRTPEREGYAFFTTPYATAPVVIITSSSIKGTLSLNDLAGRRVAVVAGYATEKYVRDHAEGNFEVVLAHTVADGLRDVSFGQADALVENLAVAAYFIKQEGLSNLRVAGSTAYSFAWSIGVSRRYPLLFSAIQKALDAIPQEEMDAIYTRWISLRTGMGLSPRILRGLGMAILFVALLLLSLSVITFVLKRRLNEKVASLRRAQEELLAQTARLRDSENLNRALFDQTVQYLGLLDAEGRVIRANRTSLRLIAKTMEEVEGASFTETAWWPDRGLARSVCEEAYAAALAGRTFRREIRQRDETGVEYVVDFALSPLLEEGGVIRYFIVEGRDVTGRRRAEEEREKLQLQLVQAQKMEAIGRLAGGVAHDFNNMLQAILGHVDLALEKLPPGHPLHGDLGEIRAAAERSADLTRQLLAFARKQTILPQVLDLNATVEGMLKILRRIIGENIELAWLPGGELWRVKVDPVQIDQILANLCVNARDAIEGVGRIAIETGNHAFDEAYCAAHPDVPLGEYVGLEVEDNGCGMDTPTLQSIFEPFFTTKAFGQGTGLGLSTIYGAVKQNRGFVLVKSAPGQGARFSVFFPRHVGDLESGPAVLPAASAMGRGETVLLVEDEPAILNMGKMLLEKMGYVALAAATPRDALRLAAEYEGGIDLLLTDVVMPSMNGWELSEKLRGIRPDLKCIFMSGYTAETAIPRGLLKDQAHFLQKPFTMRTLGAKLREALRENA